MAEESLQMLLEASGFEDGTHFKMQPREVNEDEQHSFQIVTSFYLMMELLLLIPRHQWFITSVHLKLKI